MKRITEQLTAYYRSEGLDGDDLSAAVAADLERVRVNQNVPVEPHDELGYVFEWAASPEGYDYWCDRDAAV